jgi:hypothetical protein
MKISPPSDAICEMPELSLHGMTNERWQRLVRVLSFLVQPAGRIPRAASGTGIARYRGNEPP